ncbi:MAG: hypothetical protein KDA92_04760, partial [Planctomycetales bacterium]|nr:hypothetical protein [Planctomycetales bacterium]
EIAQKGQFKRPEIGLFGDSFKNSHSLRDARRWTGIFTGVEAPPYRHAVATRRNTHTRQSTDR